MEAISTLLSATRTRTMYLYNTHAPHWRSQPMSSAPEKSADVPAIQHQDNQDNRNVQATHSILKKRRADVVDK